MMNIRKMTDRDIAILEQIDKVSFKDPWSIDFFEDEIKKDYAYCCVLADGEDICGYAVIWCIYETAELVRIAVDEKYRGKGCGSALMENIINAAKINNCEKMMLEVRKSNEAAQALYTKFGFNEIAVRKRYYCGTEDAVIMEWRLK